MRRFLAFILVVFFISVSFFFITQKSYSDELDDLNTQIGDLQTKLNMSVNATVPLESELESDQAEITNIKSRVGFITQDIAEKKKNIDASYADLSKKELLLNQTIRDFYIKSSYSSPLLIFLSADNAADITRILAYQKAAQDEDKSIITNIALSIQDLEQKKQALENEQRRLVALKANLDDESSKLDKIVQ